MSLAVPASRTLHKFVVTSLLFLNDCSMYFVWLALELELDENTVGTVVHYWIVAA